ncbi:RRP12-like protein [Eucalyptus grandis]|uniref:RRP12-like protein n=1 Tax=Eucalyptus grandis TaxID=71139 RepID=UPI00192EB400|nr:RRP12-like protein [Eucalyptus grandis]
MLNVLVSVCPYLSAKVSIQILSELDKLMSLGFSALTTLILKIIEALLETLGVGDTVQEIENVITSLASYVSSKGNSVDTVMTAANLLRVALNKFHTGGSSLWIKKLPMVWESLAGSTDHMTHTSSHFSTYTPCPSNKKITVANGSLATVVEVGNVPITPDLVLKDVLHDRDSERRIGLAKEQNGLYYLETPLTTRRIMNNLSMSYLRLLAGEADAASQASSILKDLINEQVNEETFHMESQPSDDVSEESLETIAIRRICIALESALSAHGGTPNQHALSVISLLYLKLGKASYIYMRSILLKLVHLMTSAERDPSITGHLQRCIGSAVIAMGPEKMLSVVPISLRPDNFSSSNVWLVPILRDYVVGSSLEYYMDYIVPLAKSFKRASSGVKKSVLGKELLGHAHDLWKLLPAFC